jgi:hypothetical protein
MKKLFPLLFLPLIAVAADKHVHGEANLYLVLDHKENILVEFESPAANLIGFEHEPSNAKEHHLVADAINQLHNYKNLVSFPKGECHLVTAKVHSPFSTEETHNKNGHDEHSSHHHDAHHDHKKHHDHHNEHGNEDTHASHDHHDHGSSETHAEFHAQYQLSCHALPKVKQAMITALDNFSGIETLTTEWINGDRQGTATSKKSEAILL